MASQREAIAYFRSCTVRVHGAATQGTGFFARDDLVVTCAHVLFAASGKPSAEYLVWLGRSFPLDYQRVSWSTEDDLAVIRFAAPVSDRHLPIDPAMELGEQIYSFGYTDEYADGDSVTVEYEGLTQSRRPLLKFKGGQVRPGMSGAPLLSLRTQAVCGLMTTTRDRRLAGGGRGIPGATLLAAFPHALTEGRLSLRTLNANVHGTQGPYANGAPAAQSPYADPYATGSPAPPPDGESPQPPRLIARLRNFRNEQSARGVSGSQQIRVGDLFGDEGILVPFRASYSIAAEAEIFDPVAHIITQCERVGGQAGEHAGGHAGGHADGQPGAEPPGPVRGRARMLAIAPPGTGKSTFSTALFQELAALFIQRRSTTVPILIDLREYRDQGADSEFGSQEWTQARLDEVASSPGVLTADGDGSEALRPFIILDSLDEFLAGKPPFVVDSMMRRFLFRQAGVICCRTLYYEQNLAMLPDVSWLTSIHLLPWRSEDVLEYCEKYYARLYGAARGAEMLDRFRRHLDQSTSLAAMCSVPLRLNMALDLLGPSRDRLGQATTLLGLYHTYVERLLVSEAGKGGSVLTHTRKAEYLEQIAWHFYDEGNLGDIQAPPFTQGELELLIAGSAQRPPGVSTADVVEDLRTHSLLQTDTGLFASIDPGTLRFEHKSFQEYLVARGIFHAMVSGPVRVAELFRRHLSAEVSEFLKEYIDRAGGSGRLSSVIADNCLAAYRMNRSRGASVHTTQEGRARIARAQLCYYLGSMASPRAAEQLVLIMDEESDAWTRRGIAIGLAIGGNHEYVSAYIDMLRRERIAGGRTPENDVNVGFHLTFFGDQPFDPLRPDADQGLPQCRRTIRRLTYQLDTETDRGSWRLNLYTIVDLWRHRAGSRQDCRQALSQVSPALRRIIAVRKADPWSAGWPELDDLVAVLDEAV